MTTGERIKRRRKELGLSADQLGEMVGKTRATIYRYESDDVKDFPISVLKPLAEVLRTTPAELMGWKTSDSIEHVMELPSIKRVSDSVFISTKVANNEAAPLVQALKEMLSQDITYDGVSVDSNLKEYLKTTLDLVEKSVRTK